MTDKLVVLSTCKSQSEAEKIARHLVGQQLAACVNILPGIRSIFRWQGAVEEASEVLMVIKTRQDLFESLREELAKIHSYEVPEILALPIVDGSDPYLAWLDGTLLRAQT
ncbi:MAG: divalent-cation tolerance protein CutA [Acidobacteriota bacterium]